MIYAKEQVYDLPLEKCFDWMKMFEILQGSGLETDRYTGKKKKQK